MAKPRMDLSTFVGKLLEEQDWDVLREGVRVLPQAGGLGRSSLITHYSLLITHYSLLTHYSSLTTHHSLLLYPVCKGR